MKPFSSVLLLAAILSASLAVAGDFKPKRNAQEYRYYEVTEVYSIGVNLLSEEDAAALLTTPLSGRFFAVEIAFFPGTGKSVEVDPGEFTLREAESGRASLPMAASEVSTFIHKSAKKPKRNVTLFPSVGVGVGTSSPGNYPNDPNDPTGRNRPGNSNRVGTSVGVGVGIGDERQPGGAPGDRDVMESELSDHSLASGSFEEPVAGLIYFPVGRMQPDSRKVLEYRDPSKPATVKPLRIDLAPILGP